MDSNCRQKYFYLDLFLTAKVTHRLYMRVFVLCVDSRTLLNIACYLEKELKDKELRTF